jgi:hypothetical protein
MLLVLGKQTTDAINFVRDHELDQRNVRIVRSKYSFKGYCGADLCILYDYEELEDLELIDDELMYKVSIGDINIVDKLTAIDKYKVVTVGGVK